MEPDSIKKEARLNRAAEVGKSDLIKKFHGSGTKMGQAVTVSAATPAAVAPAEPIATKAATITPPQPIVKDAPKPASQPPVIMPTMPVDAPEAKPSIGAPVTTSMNDMKVKPPGMPNAVATQVEAMNKLATAPERQAAFQTAMATPGPKPAALAGVAVAIALMGGYIWLKNYPSFAVKVASTKAGIEAALPAYLPSGFSLTGSVDASPGQVSASFSSPSGIGDLKITQRRTNWDADSLLDNYVAKQSGQYLAIQRQGLTIYFYGQGQAAWINRGIWYTIEGTNKLNRDQVLHIIDSL